MIVLTRSSASPAVRSLAANGATICEVDLADGLNAKERQEDLRNALKGVDVLVDVLAHYVEPAKTALFQAALDTGVKVYFPSEFGVSGPRPALS